MIKDKFPFYHQHDVNDCGPVCVKMIAKYYGKETDLNNLRRATGINRNGVSLLGIGEAAEQIGFRTLMLKVSFEKLKEIPRPCILFWAQDHFVVLLDESKPKGIKAFFSSKKNKNKTTYRIADPAHGIVNVDEKLFKNSWLNASDDKGIVLALYPTPGFYETVEQKKSSKKEFSFLMRYVSPYKKHFYQLIIGMIAGSVISLIFPFLTQALIDYGVNFKSKSIVLLILISQLMLFLGESVIGIFRNWILLHVNTRISISVISDFLTKLMRLPLSFFDTKSTGDLFQRIKDHSRVEEFLTGTALETMFSFINVIIFSFILAFYSLKIFITFFVLSMISVFWILIFMERRKHIDYEKFQRLRENQDSIFEIINGIQEIKLNNSEISRKWQWEKIQANLFKLNIRSLLLDQYQLTGFVIITRLKNIFIAFISAIETINGDMTLGMMLSVSYIIGQTNGPLQQLAYFFRSAQDAKISLNRLQEVHELEDEEATNNENNNMDSEVQMLGNSQDLVVENLSFQYGSSKSNFVLKDISLTIPKGKITAIVGTSGSGKTTLLKLLLKFYEPTQGNIFYGKTNMKKIPNKFWRDQCGTVMQDGYIFADTITRNIVIDGKEIDKKKLLNSVRTAHVQEMIESRPLGYTTILNNNGSNLSGGQRQRLLIARSVYKNPDYLFFDEATSSLDANTEKIISQNLDEFFENKTVVIIAHRLSTVKNADQIVVLDKGKIMEIGNHKTLIELKGNYYHLVKNQLELGE